MSNHIAEALELYCSGWRYSRSNPGQRGHVKHVAQRGKYRVTVDDPRTEDEPYTVTAHGPNNPGAVPKSVVLTQQSDHDIRDALADVFKDVPWLRTLWDRPSVDSEAVVTALLKRPELLYDVKVALACMKIAAAWKKTDGSTYDDPIYIRPQPPEPGETEHPRGILDREKWLVRVWRADTTDKYPWSWEIDSIHVPGDTRRRGLGPTKTDAMREVDTILNKRDWLVVGGAL